MRRTSAVAVAVLCAAAVACSASRRAQNDDLSRAEARWKQAGLTKFTYRRSARCFCSKRYQEPLTVTEDHGRVIALTDSAGQAIDLSGTEQPIDSLFAEIRAVQRYDYIEVRVVFDSTLGYPRAFSKRPAPGGGTFEPSTIWLDSLKAVP